MPWMASSWLYDVGVAAGYRAFDLLIIPLTAIACKLSLAVLTFLLAGGLARTLLDGHPFIRGRPIRADQSAASSCLFFSAALRCRVASADGIAPHRRRSASLLAAAAVLAVGECRCPIRHRDIRASAVCGRIARGRVGTDAAAPQDWRDPSNSSLSALGAITAASLLATVITPYGWNLYGVFWARISSSANVYFPDFQSLRFRSPQDYLLLLLIAGAFLALGIRRSRDVFQISLLLLCTFAAFHSRRDAWLAALAAVAILGKVLSEPDSQSAREESPLSRSALSQSKMLLAAGLAIALLAGAAAIHFPRSHAAMLAKVGRAYPVAAADYIRDHQLPQPLFNSLPWGGFLTWYLPEYPVAIDGRTDLYGDDANIQYAKVMNAEAHFSTLPALNQAGTLLLEKNSLMGVAFATVPGFKVAYSDNVAVVLTRERSAP